jgi:hypothetical protein
MSEQSKTEVSKLLSQLSKKRAGGITSAVDTVLRSGSSQSGSGTARLSLGKADGLSARGGLSGDFVEARGIDFGRPSSNPAAKEEPNPFLELAKRSASGGISKALGGGGVLGALGGLGGLVSQITSLFGGSKKSETPLTLFQLPDSINQTVTIGSQKSATTPENGFNSNGGATSQDQSAYIVKVVKNALLTSSSLNDVISDL